MQTLLQVKVACGNETRLKTIMILFLKATTVGGFQRAGRNGRVCWVAPNNGDAYPAASDRQAMEPSYFTDPLVHSLAEKRAANRKQMVLLFNHFYLTPP